MRKNVFIKSSLRQPLRSFLLFLLVGLASFAFVLRFVEMTAVDRHIHTIAAHYRSIGFLQGSTDFFDVSVGAVVLSDSPHVAFEDRRRQVEGILHDHQSPDIVGMSRLAPIEYQRRRTQAYFYGTVESVEIQFFLLPPGIQLDSEAMAGRRIDVGFYEYIVSDHITLNHGDSVTDMALLRLSVKVDNVLAGMPQHVIEGQYVLLNHIFYPFDDATQRAIEELEIGGRYLFKATYFARMDFADSFGAINILPRIGRESDWLNFTAICDESGLYFVPAPEGETVDFAAMGLTHILDDIATLNRHHRAVSLRTTIDMTALPKMQGAGSTIRMVRGRMIDLDDYLAANPVAVVNFHFAHTNGLDIGDTFVMSVYNDQFIDGIVTGLRVWQDHDVFEAGSPRVSGGVTSIVRAVTEVSSEEFYVRSVPCGNPPAVVELEVVGIYNDVISRAMSYGFGIIYVPDSVIPAHIAAGEPRREIQLPEGWSGGIAGQDYSFILTGTRHEMTFIEEYRDILMAHGIRLILFQSGAGDFWAAADPILLVLTFNTVVFGLILILTLSLVSFLCLRQRRRDIVIMRALGVPHVKVFAQLLLSVLITWTPAVLLGGILAWYWGIAESGATLAPFAQLAAEEASQIFDPFNRLDIPGAILRDGDVIMPFAQFFMIAGGIIVLLLTVAAIGLALIMRFSILEQLQGRAAHVNKKARGETETVLGFAPQADFAALPKTPLVKTASAKYTNTICWVWRHITRAAAKTALGVMVALVFVVALGWLQESIVQTQIRLDELYNTLIVNISAEALRPPSMAPNSIITRVGAVNLSASHYVNDVAKEAIHPLAIIFPADADGSLPSDWPETVGFSREQGTAYNRAAGVLNGIIAVSSLDAFTQEHHVELIGAEDGFVIGFGIDFMYGFTTDDFVFLHDFERMDVDLLGFDTRIPVVISQSIAYSRGLELGDEAYLAYGKINLLWGSLGYAPAIVVGIHNEHIMRPSNESNMIIPISALEAMNGWLTFYTRVSASLDPSYNRQLAVARTEVLDILHSRSTSLVPLNVLISDEEIRVVAGAMAQVLLILELMYPVALALAAIIAGAKAMLLVLQSAKNAGIMRTLGVTKLKTGMIIAAEVFVVNIAGLITGLVILIALAMGFGTASLIGIAALYFCGIIGGSLIGVITIIAKKPLELLQIRE